MLREINRDLAIVDLRTIDEMIARSASQRRMPAALLATIGLLGVLRHGFLIVGIGSAIGMPVTFVLSRIMRNLIAGGGALDPLTAVSVCAVLPIAGSIALYLPARWASTRDPAHILRSE